MNEAQPRKNLIDPAIEKAGWTKASLPLFAGEGLEVGFPKVLDAAEEGDFGFCQPVAGRQLQIGEFKCAKDIGQLKETVARRRHLRHEFRLGRKRRERLLENRRDLCLTVVVEDLQPFVSVKSLRVCNEKGEDLLKQGVVHRIGGGDETLVHVKAFVRELGFARECQHLGEDETAFFAAHVPVILLSTDERTCMNAMGFSKSKIAKFFFEFGQMGCQVNGLIMEDHADEVVSRGDVLSVKAPRFVNEDADFLCRSHGRTKGKMKAGIAPRPQRRLLRLPMTPVLPFVWKYYRKNFDCAQGGMSWSFHGGCDCGMLTPMRCL